MAGKKGNSGSARVSTEKPYEIWGGRGSRKKKNETERKSGGHYDEVQRGSKAREEKEKNLATEMD